MNTYWKTTIYWAGIALSIFAVLSWLFNIAVPDAAVEFSLGITSVLMVGLISGRYISRAWLSNYSGPAVFYILVMLISLGIIAIGILVNRMIGQTQFVHFLSTLLLLVIVSGSISALITLSRDRMKQKILSAQTSMAVSKSELQLLQAQLSPHFLFNTLNNIYGLSITDHEKVPQLLLKLSSLLRYSVYEVKEIFVPLRDELEYLRNYIDFETLRLGEEVELTVTLEEVQDNSVVIAPMLLVVLVENAFKHSRNAQGKKAVIDIDLKMKGDDIHFLSGTPVAKILPNLNLIKSIPDLD